MTNKPTPRVANCSGELWVLDELGNPKYKPDLHNSNAIDKIVIAVNTYDANQALIAEKAAEIARLKLEIESARAEGMNTERSANWMNADRRDKEQRQTIDALTAALEQVVKISDDCPDYHEALDSLGQCKSVATDALEKARGESGEHQES